MTHHSGLSGLEMNLMQLSWSRYKASWMCFEFGWICCCCASWWGHWHAVSSTVVWKWHAAELQDMQQCACAKSGEMFAFVSSLQAPLWLWQHCFHLQLFFHTHTLGRDTSWGSASPVARYMEHSPLTLPLQCPVFERDPHVASCAVLAPAELSLCSSWEERCHYP